MRCARVLLAMIAVMAPGPGRGALDARGLNDHGDREGSLLVWADGLCRIQVDGEAVGTLAGGEWLRVAVKLGEHRVEAEGLEDVVMKDARTVMVGVEPAVVRLSVWGRGGGGERPGGGDVRASGAEQRVNAMDGLSYVFIPPGEFLMGCVPSDTCSSDQFPRHSVRLTRGIWLGKTEVTRDAFARGPGPTARPLSRFFNSQTGSDPVVDVTWDEASAYCAWSGGRLPTEAEWEYAARGGVPDEFYPWTGGPTHDLANYGGREGRDQWEFTSPVASFPANRSWLYDMAGNAAEWVSDWYDGQYYSNSPATDPPGPASGSLKVLRGGYWLSGGPELRASVRGRREPVLPNVFFGFRCARDVSP